MVVSPCAALSAQEALYFGKPLLCIPMLSDQLDAAARVADRGAGVIMSKLQLLSYSATVQAEAQSLVKQVVVTLLRNSSFRVAAVRLGNVLRAAGGCSLAADLTEAALGVPLAHAGQPLAQHLPLLAAASAPSALPAPLTAQWTTDAVRSRARCVSRAVWRWLTPAQGYWHQGQQVDIVLLGLAACCVVAVLLRAALLGVSRVASAVLAALARWAPAAFIRLSNRALHAQSCPPLRAQRTAASISGCRPSRRRASVGGHELHIARVTACSVF